jgi:hypothetical protein
MTVDVKKQAVGHIKDRGANSLITLVGEKFVIVEPQAN